MKLDYDLPPDRDEANIGLLVQDVVRQWRKIALVIVVTTLVALVSVMGARPQFLSTGALYLGDAQVTPNTEQPTAAGLGFLSDFQSSSDVNTQVELIKTRALVERAVLETGLNVSITPQDTPQPQFWRWRLFDHLDINTFRPRVHGLVGVFAVLSDAGLAQGVFNLRFAGSGHYRLTAKSSWFLPSYDVLTGTLGQPAAGGGLSVLIMPNYAGYQPPSGATFTMSVLSARLVAEQLIASRLSVVAGGTATQPTSVVQLSLRWWNPYRGTQFVNQLMADFIATQLAWKTESASATETFIRNQLDKIKISLITADQSLADYQSRTGLIDVSENAKANIDRLAEYEVQRTNLQLQQLALQQLHNDIAKSGTNLNPFLLNQTSDPVLQQLSGQLADALAKLHTLSVQFTPDSTEVQIEQAQLSAISGSIRILLTNELAAANANLANINEVIAKFNEQLKDVPNESLRVGALARASEVFGKLYELLMQKEVEAEVSKAAATINTRIVSLAEVPFDAASPKPTLTILLGMFFGLFAGLSFILAQRSFSPLIQSEGELRDIAPVPVYGFIPESPFTSAWPFYNPQGYNVVAEAFRLLRNGLADVMPTGQPTVIAVCSTANNDGGPFVAANLAKAVAEEGQRTLLIDADLHSSGLIEVLHLNRGPGMAETAVVQPVPKQDFSFIGPALAGSNPNKLLNRKLFAENILALRMQYDLIIINSPPLPAAADSVIIAASADFVLSVAMIGSTPRRAWRSHNDWLRPLNSRRAIVVAGVPVLGRGLRDAANKRPRLFGRAIGLKWW